MEIQNDLPMEKTIDIPLDDEQKPARPTTRRYNKRGKRRGKYAYAAPLGMLISLLAVVGVIALVITGINAIRRSTDTSALEEELYYFLEPVLVYTPAAFEDIAVAEEQDVFLNAATYRVMLAEQIRMLREGDETTQYAVDDNGRLAVPVAEIDASYDALFGTAAPLTHRSLDDSGLSYSEADDVYYVPFEVANTGYRVVVDTVKRKGNTYLVRVGYVLNTDILLDEHGNEIKPTADMATHYQTYTLTRTEESYYISACADN